ncbi:11671_t:CDS:1, partial [Ambispora leptoticha]
VTQDYTKEYFRIHKGVIQESNTSSPSSPTRTPSFPARTPSSPAQVLNVLNTKYCVAKFSNSTTRDVNKYKHDE